VNVRGHTIAAGRGGGAADPPSLEEVVRLLQAVRRQLHLSYVHHERPGSVPDFLPYVPLFALVAQNPGITISELGRMTGMTKSQVSVVMARAVRQGWASKEADRSDLRLVRLRMTAAGRVQLSRWRAARHRILLRALRSLPPEQLVAVTASLRALLDALKGGGSAADPEATVPTTAGAIPHLEAAGSC